MAKGTLCSIEGEKTIGLRRMDQQNHVWWETPVLLGVTQPTECEQQKQARKHGNGLTSSSVGPLARRLWPPSCPHPSNSISRSVARRNGICLKMPWVVQRHFQKVPREKKVLRKRKGHLSPSEFTSWECTCFWWVCFTHVWMEMKLILVILAAMQPW